MADRTSKYKRTNSVFTWLENAGYKKRDVCGRIHISYSSYNRVAHNPYQYLTLFHLDCIYLMLFHVRDAKEEPKYSYSKIYEAIYGRLPYRTDLKFFEEQEPYLEDLMETAKQCLNQS